MCLSELCLFLVNWSKAVQTKATVYHLQSVICSSSKICLEILIFEFSAGFGIKVLVMSCSTAVVLVFNAAAEVLPVMESVVCLRLNLLTCWGLKKTKQV